jgi:hypothetical protein
MRKLTIKQIIEFKNKSENSKETFALNLKIDKEKNNVNSGGDYWISALSTISNGFKYNDNSYILEKIHELEDKFEQAEYKKTKVMYQRNIEILYKFESFDFSKWIPTNDFTTIKKHKSNFILDINGLQIQVIPHHVFTFKNVEEEIGAILFIAKLNGYTQIELATFTDILYRYLNINFSKDYKINPDFCTAVDVVKVEDISYSKIINEGIPLTLDSIINEIKKLM